MTVKRKTKTIIIMLSLNIIFFAASGILYAFNKTRAAIENEPVYVSSVSTSDIVSIKCDLQENDESYELQKNGDSWICINREGFPLNGDSVDNLIQKTQNLTAARMVSSESV